MSQSLLSMRLAPLFLLVAAPAFAQTTGGLTMTINGSDTATVGVNDCDEPVTVTWTVATSSASCSDLTLWATESECGEAAGANDRKYTSVSSAVLATQRTGTFNVVVKDLPAFGAATDGGTACGVLVAEKTHRVCGAFK